ncbi:hypothetical protein CA951_39830 [Rhodococcus sp. NCIMB 12038]|nr:hypothetical protein CA951_39830 [Rhodococcus sp. NCIMB 12038]
MFLALTSASRSPGVSTTALALALNSPTDRTLLVEADAIGSSPVLAGYMLGNHYHDRSLINLVDANRHGRLKAALTEQLIQIPESSVSLLPGLVHSAQADAMRPVWGPLGVHLAGLSVDDTNVIVDAGRIGHRGAPVELIVNATTIAIVTRTERTAIAALRASQNALRQQLSAVQSRASLGLILIGESPYNAEEVTKVTGLDVIAVLPDSDDAKVFSDGLSISKWRRRRSLYLHTLHRSTWPKINKFAVSHQADLKSGPALNAALPTLTGERR